MDWTGFENDDGTINTDHPVFQQGRNLYECQRVIYDITETAIFRTEILMAILKKYCELITAVGYLRAEYSSLIRERDAVNKELRSLVEKTRCQG